VHLQIVPTGAAARSGKIWVNDAILSIDGKHVTSIADAKAMIVGEHGSYITLGLQRVGVGEFTVTIARGTGDVAPESGGAGAAGGRPVSGSPDTWSVKELKQALQEAGVSTAGAYEREELVSLAKEHKVPPPGTKRSSGGGGGGGFFGGGGWGARGAAAGGGAPPPAAKVTLASGDDDYYDLLGVTKDATDAQIKKGYYKMARQWHPDKNPDNAEAELKFKAISEAYECLSDPQKRQIYNTQGKEGVHHAASGQVDIKMVFKLMFGGGQFDELFGDVCELPMLKQMIGVQQQNPYEQDPRFMHANQEKLRREEDIYCKQLAIKLKEKLEQCAALGDRGFKELCDKDGLELCEAPGGVELLAMVGYVYAQEGKQYGGRFFGFEGFFAQIQEKAHVASTGTAVLMDAIKTANMHQEMQAGARSEEEQRKNEAKMMRSGLNVVWKMGKMLLEERVRRVCEIMMSSVDKDARKVAALGHALIEMGECYERLAEKESKNEARKSNSRAQIPGMPPEE